MARATATPTRKTGSPSARASSASTATATATSWSRPPDRRRTGSTLKRRDAPPRRVHTHHQGRHTMSEPTVIRRELDVLVHAAQHRILNIGPTPDRRDV